MESIRTGVKNRQYNHLLPTALITFLFIIMFCSCSNAQNSASEKNILIVYLSRTNNTKAVAEMIHEKLGCDLVALEKKDPYPENYQEIVNQVARENDEGFLPELKTRIDNLKNYDTIFIGFPTWDMQMPPPMKTFLTENDFSGKTVIPFNTNAGFGVGRGFEQVKEFCSDSEILEGFSVEGGYEKKGVFLAIKNQRAVEVENEVEKWLQKIHFIKNRNRKKYE